MSLFRPVFAPMFAVLMLPGWLAAASTLPLESVISYDFEDQLLGTIGLDGPDAGQPYWKSSTLEAEVIEFEGGQALQISSEEGGFEGLRFELPGQQGIREHRARVRLRIMMTEETYWGLGFRGPLGASSSYDTLHIRNTGGFQVTGADGLPALNFGSYTPGEPFELVFDMNLYNRTWDIWVDGVREVSNRPMNTNFATSAGLGRFFFTGSSFYDGSPIVIDEFAIERSRDLPVLLDTAFEDSALGAIGTAGPTVGEPVAVAPSLMASVEEDGGGDRILSLERMAWVGPEQPVADWGFLYAAEPDSGLVEADLTLIPRLPGLYVATLHDSDGNDVVSIQVDMGLGISLVYPGETPIAVGDAVLDEAIRLRLACHLDQRDCSVALNDRWAVFNEMFADVTPDGIAIAGMRTGHLGPSPIGAQFELSEVSLRTSQVAGLASRIEFLEQPSTTQCGMTIMPQIRVAVTDALGDPVPDWTEVTLSHDSEQIPPSALAGAIAEVFDGQAQFSAVLTQRAEDIRLTASAGDAFNLVSATSESFDILPGPPTTGHFLVQPGDAGAGQAIAPTVSVQVLDNCAEPQPAGVSYSLVIAEGPEGASLANATVLSDDDGIASFDDLSVDMPGTFRLAIAVDGLLMPGMSDPFTVSAVPGAASFVVQPVETVVGQIISPAVQVLVEDSLGAAMPDGTVVNLALEAPDGAVLSNPAAATLDGLAVFDALSVSLPGEYRLRASVTGLAAEDEPLSLGFQIVAGPPAQIDFQQQPDGGLVGTALTPAVIVRLSDVDGFAVADGLVVTIELAAAPAGAELAGTLSRPVTDGLAVFDDLNLDLAGSYRLRARHDALSVESEDFVLVGDRMFYDRFESSD
jgi:hypothetical protein